MKLQTLQEAMASEIAYLRTSLKEHLCEIILKSGHWPRRRCCLKVFLFLALVAILFSGTKPF